MLTTTGAARGWYFYGITRRDSCVSAPSTLLGFAELAAVVRPVVLAEFTAGALQERLRDVAALEAAVRSHNGVIEAIHARQAILPAKFGTVYADADDVVAALRPAHDELLQQLEQLDGCDEYAVHLYADRAVVRERVVAEDPTVAQLRAQCAKATPGRAYFLEQQLRQEIEDATAAALSGSAMTALERIGHCAVDAQVGPLTSSSADGPEAEILRVAFLVARDGAERFRSEVESEVLAGEGLRCECSGPWPPYSFAARAGEGRE